MAKELAWGLLATGAIAKAFAKGVVASKTGKLAAVGSRSLEKAQAFAKEFGAPKAHGSYEALLADADVEAVYISTPHPMHAEWAIKAARAGKHILCEKPIGLNHAQAMAIVEAARANNVFLMEAFMYRCHPQTAKLVELVKGGAIGQVKMIQATFSFQTGPNPDSRLMANKLGGGGILDVGCYATSMSRLIAGAATGQPFADPIAVQGMGHVGETGVDEYAAGLLKFAGPQGPIIAQIATGVRLNQDSSVRIYGSDGWIHVANPWIPAREGGAVKIALYRGREAAEEIKIKTDAYLYGLEADTVAESLPDLQAAPPAMSWDDTLGNMRTLDQWRKAVGVVYEDERPQKFAGPLHGGALEHPRKNVTPAMKYATIPGVDKQVSRLIMGCDNQSDFSHAAVMFDEWFERGGNAFDTAYIYGGGTPEKLLGAWMKSRGVREKAVVVAKGAHTPYCNPKDLSRQLLESLERLQMDYADLYIMHRDNLDIPVGEFVDVLNEHLAAGRFKAFGGSNWTTARMQEANQWAAEHGKTGFAVLSNNFSLARMVEPPWGGCVAASDADSRAWLKETQTTLCAWSSQARGFFTDRAGPDKRDDAELVRCWYSDDNFQRRQRAVELAKKKGVLPINIAAAYVLNQPFPTFALIGPRVLHELTTSLPALDVELSRDEVKWLNLED